ncbi:MAG: NAD(P)H-hydrate dehydratase [Solirubrobacteraceae bacterium]
MTAWLDPLPDAQEMRVTDRWATEQRGIASIELMERAGSGLARVAAELAPEGPLSVLCGKGNNGGDGLVCARLLRQRGRDVEVLMFGEPAAGSDAHVNLERLPGAAPTGGSRVRSDGGLVIDALLGTGFAGELEGELRAVVEALAAAGASVLACDVPSGVDASTGEVHGPAVRARATVTFHAAKPGLWINPGKEHAGDVRVVDIGIPPGGPAHPPVGLMRRAALVGQIPRRQRDSNKFVSGHVIVVGGSPGLTGAPCMAAEAAMRAGAGYVTACIPASLSLIFETRLLEVMTLALEHHDSAGVDCVLGALKAGSALVLGPGLGSEAGEFSRELAARAQRPLLLDADGLNAHAGQLASLRSRTHPTVLTPHDGELARLLELETHEVAARRLTHARAAADRGGAVVVLKGDDTLVAEPGGRVAVSPGASPALATAGTGDVLSGVCGAMLAKGMEPFEAACAAVTLHARAGRHAAEMHGPDGVIASDVIQALPRSLA